MAQQIKVLLPTLTTRVWSLESTRGGGKICLLWHNSLLFSIISCFLKKEKGKTMYPRADSRERTGSCYLADFLWVTWGASIWQRLQGVSSALFYTPSSGASTVLKLETKTHFLQYWLGSSYHTRTCRKEIAISIHSHLLGNQGHS